MAKLRAMKKRERDKSGKGPFLDKLLKNLMLLLRFQILSCKIVQYQKNTIENLQLYASLPPLFLLREGPPNAGLKSSLQDTYGKKKIQCAPLTRHGCYLLHPACGLFTLAGRIIEDGKKRRLPRSNLTPAIFGAEKSQTGKSENSFPAAMQC